MGRFLERQLKSATKAADATSKALAPRASGGVAECKPGCEKEKSGGVARGNLAPGLTRNRTP